MNLMEAYGIQAITDDGFFSDVYNLTYGSTDALPFMTTEYEAQSIDFIYYFKRSGDKYVSSVISKIISEELTGQQRVAIAQAFVTMFGDTLKQAWAAYTAEYDVTEPYHITESTTYEHSGSSGVDYTGTISDAHTGTVTDVASDVTTDNTVFGFNSGSTGKPSSSSEQNGTTTRTNGDTITKTFNNSNDGEESASDTLEVTKSGNLGVTDFSTLISREIELRNLNFFTNTLFPMVDKYLTLPIY